MLLPLLVGAMPLRAQWSASGELGASHLRQSGLAESNAFMIGGGVDYLASRAAFSSSLLAAQTGDGGMTGQWLGAMAVATPAWHSWTVQGIGTLSAFGQSHLRPTSSADGLVQLRLGDARRGGSIGAGAGATSHNAVSIPNNRALLDVWWTAAMERVSLGAAITRTAAVFGESSILVDVSDNVVDYMDLSASWRHDATTWSIGATVGGRGQGSFRIDQSWQSVDGELWIAPRAAVAASVGRTLEDLVRGVPRTQYATLSLRVTAQPHLHVFARRGGHEVEPRAVVTSVGDRREVRIIARSASRVELMGDFTEWMPVEMENGAGVWTVRRAIAPGLHRMAIRINGGAWTPPLNLPKVDDDLGGTVGLITVP